MDRILTVDDPVTTGACGAGTALTVDAGVTLNLGDRTISGDGSGQGLLLDAASRLLGPGTVQGFTRAVIGMTGADAIVVADVTATLSDDNAFDFVSDGNTFLRNAAIDNGGDGIFLVGSGNVVMSTCCGTMASGARSSAASDNRTTWCGGTGPFRTRVTAWSSSTTSSRPRARTSPKTG
ncbi:MAG TPA: hypothetical protein VEL28_20160 [Candidatus Binatia bacterium]|nr:hypothetical protein [Candidatus Binatia bacterium]